MDLLRPGDPAPLLLAAAVGAGTWLVSVAVVGPLIALQTGVALRRVWVDLVLGVDRIEKLALVGQVGFGLLVAAIAVSHGWLAALLLLPVGAAYQALAHHVRRRREAEARLRHLAYHDWLTGLPNRALLLERLDQAVGRDRATGLIALFFLDVDRFKFVNDSLGHAVGDQLLVALGRRLRSLVRGEDVVARFGGDEFAILLPAVPDRSAAERLAAATAKAVATPLDVAGKEVRVSASIGVALARPGAARAADLLQDADVALYRVKQQRDLRWSVFDAEMDAATRERIALEVQLNRPETRDQLRVAYQPVVDLATGRIRALEALARWEHPERGLLQPEAFIPVAEETGLIVRIGGWVLEDACRTGKVWQDRYHHALEINVNVSARQFQHPRLVEDIAHVLQRTGLPPSHLKLELTESAMMTDVDQAVATLRRLNALGVRIAIDDFGTGYSSLGYLQRFPVDQLKIDRRFVSGLGDDDGDTAIVRAVAGLARALGLAVVAEGVETAAQAAKVRELGCGLAQGYYFGRPVPPETMTELLAATVAGPGLRRAVARV